MHWWKRLKENNSLRFSKLATCIGNILTRNELVTYIMSELDAGKIIELERDGNRIHLKKLSTNNNNSLIVHYMFKEYLDYDRNIIHKVTNSFIGCNKYKVISKYLNKPI